MNRKEIAKVLDECGTLLELKGENPFRANAYHNASRAIQRLEGDLDDLLEQKKLGSVKGIGKTMVEKVEELVETGSLKFLEKLRGEVPSGLVEMLRINGFGPKRIHQAYKELGVDSVEKLKLAASDGRLAGMKGFGKKTAEKVLEGIAFLDESGRRVLYPVARELAERVMEALAGHPAIKRMTLCGSLRRGRATIKDIDLLVASDDSEPIMKQFVELPDVRQIVGHGSTKSSVVLDNGMACDLRVVADKHFPFAMHYFTGSKEHNVAMRARAQDYGLKLNEYELAGEKKNIACKEEEDIFAALDLDPIPPELREDTGEIAAAADKSLPKLLESGDLTGIFHCHTTASDGGATLEEMAAGAKAAGFGYLGLADHSQTAAYANGLSPERVREQQKKIDAFNAKSDGFRLFKGIESDILADGSLDYDEKTLESFDYVVASIHQPMNMSETEMTERICRAIRHPRCTMIGHLTGRLLLHRDGYPLDVETILREAAKHNTMIEINAHPWRLDLDWVNCKRAKALGVKVAINPDAHSVEGIDDTKYGVLTARRGWLEAGDVFNTLPVDEIAKRLRAGKDG
ncbi:DNA polymerase/3'-5' exonuclease PolX [Planctomycetes bacterium Pan216]|uniref:DNA polymerase beta n=1 Tax=Kolteria novifilia TaxID=2527975 RepID=A0A518B7E7_9BACT|nr:DNA polymerase/3'-5' exonuclease PolX [Planctomycetes bacterium Pan216]